MHAAALSARVTLAARPVSTARRAVARRVSTAAMANFHSLSAKDIDGNDVDFAKFKGKVCLVTNVACT